MTPGCGLGPYPGYEDLRICPGCSVNPDSGCGLGPYPGYEAYLRWHPTRIANVRRPSCSALHDMCGAEAA